MSCQIKQVISDAHLLFVHFGSAQTTTGCWFGCLWFNKPLFGCSLSLLPLV